MGTGTVMAGQTMAEFIFQPTCPTWCYLYSCVLVPRLNSGGLAVYSCDRAHGNLQV